MNEKMTQAERLDFLVEQFKADSIDYKDLQTPGDVVGKRRLLRSLMNIRSPRHIDDLILRVQDEYLKGVADEHGIVEVNDIPIRSECLSIWQGDITRLSVDAIVNAANSQMLGCFVPMHTCIDNCIKFGADYQQPTGIPMLTDGYNLPAKKVIHVVGPIVQFSLTHELEQDLANCYINTLNMCMENSLKTVAFCCISTGVFHFPNERAAEIAVSTVRSWLSEHPGVMDRVIFNVFKDEDRGYYERLI